MLAAVEQGDSNIDFPDIPEITGFRKTKFAVKKFK